MSRHEWTNEIAAMVHALRQLNIEINALKHCEQTAKFEAMRVKNTLDTEFNFDRAWLVDALMQAALDLAANRKEGK